MENWHVNPTTGLMICTQPNGVTLVASPGRDILAYGPSQVEHVTLHGVCVNGLVPRNFLPMRRPVAR